CRSMPICLIRKERTVTICCLLAKRSCRRLSLSYPRHRDRYGKPSTDCQINIKRSSSCGICMICLCRKLVRFWTCRSRRLRPDSTEAGNICEAEWIRGCNKTKNESKTGGKFAV